MSKMLIVRLESFEGRDTSLVVVVDDMGNEGEMFVIVNVETGEVDDYGYRTFDEACQACPTAMNAKPQAQDQDPDNDTSEACDDTCRDIGCKRAHELRRNRS